jgi:predicted small lipoprotein YifL
MSVFSEFRRLPRWLLLAAALSVVAACGQKGPLYRPTKAASSQAGPVSFA